MVPLRRNLISIERCQAPLSSMECSFVTPLMQLAASCLKEVSAAFSFCQKRISSFSWRVCVLLCNLFAVYVEAVSVTAETVGAAVAYVVEIAFKCHGLFYRDQRSILRHLFYDGGGYTGTRYRLLYFLAKQGVDLNAVVDRDGRTLAHIAAANGSNSVLRFLSWRGCHLDATDRNGNTPLDCAHSRTIKFFTDLLGRDRTRARKLQLQGIAANEQDPLYVAVANGDISTLSYLIDEQGADVNAAARLAARGGCVSALRFLSWRGCKLDVTGRDDDLAKLAAIHGHSQVLELLEDQGVDLHRAVDEFGNSLAYWVARGGHLQVLEFLADRGLDLHRVDESVYGLAYWATSNGHLQVLKFLADKGVDLHRVDEYGNSLASLAARGGHLQVLEFLVDQGVDLSRVTSAALFGSQFSVLEFLEKRGLLDKQLAKFHSYSLLSMIEAKNSSH